MYQKERLDDILLLLKKHGYVTVKFLTEELHYSVATINRDLNLLEKQKLIKRSYGGAELAEVKGVSLMFRYHKMKSAKTKLGKKAAEFVCDGDTLFIDASTTTQAIAPHLIDKKDLTVITNNLALALYLSEYGANVVVLGGKIIEAPTMLGDVETVAAVSRYHADKAFFSSGGITKDGRIATSQVYELLHSAMVHNADHAYYLVDHEKIDEPSLRYALTAADVDCVISDYVFPDETKAAYPDTQFVTP